MIFLGLSAITILSAVIMVLSRRPIYSIISLIVCLYGLGGIYLLTQSQFLAIVHMIVYAGAIMVLFLFVIMLMNLDFPESLIRHKGIRLGAILTSGVIATIIISRIDRFAPSDAVRQSLTVKAIGKLMFTQYIAVFELSTIVFLSATIGVILVAGSRPVTPR
ncbi:NADH-quinone oxidoreductase subunit J [bacterium]|nr:NADH-quinone oxidoreductase subunit J [bacterium]